jgi:4Fe-4S dicluster domain
VKMRFADYTERVSSRQKFIPMPAKTMTKADAARWLEMLIQQAEVIAPTAGHGGDAIFAAVSSPDNVLWSFENPLYPPKHVVLPRTDPIVEIRRNDGGYEVEPLYDDRPRILFNVRSCDVKGIEYLDRMHMTNPPDASYLRRSRNIIKISLACVVPCHQCFCICTDSGPFLRNGYDVQLTDLGDNLLVEAGSDKGATLLSYAGTLFRPATVSEISRRMQLEDTAKRLFGKDTCHLASAMRRISTGRVQDGLWAKMSDWCLECGGCTLICPTCYCFSVKDRGHDGAWVRCRIWDSCQYPAFTLEASGHNPREHRKDRMKRRFFHKVSAQYYTRDGMVGCVGCGRCIKVCLGTTDMPSVVTAIRKGEWRG